jgi:hypothetical protein
MAFQKQVEQAKQKLIYVVEFLVENRPQKVLVHAYDAPNGVIMDAPEGSDSYIGNLLNGKQIEIPIAAVTNVFAWWRVKTKETGQGHRSYTLDDKAMNEHVQGAQRDPKRWDENGCLKDVEKKDKPGDKDRIIRGK